MGYFEKASRLGLSILNVYDDQKLEKDELYMQYCNCVGISYRRLSENSLARDYFFKAVDFLKKEGNGEIPLSMIYSSIGVTFNRKGNLKMD